MTSHNNIAVLVVVEKSPRRQQKQHLPLQQAPQQQENANLGAQPTRNAGRRNASGLNVMDALHVLQGGSGEVTSCFNDGTRHSDT